MPVHQFTLIVEGRDLQDDAFIDRLFEAGCDDAAAGRIDGVQYVDFYREAASYDEAVLSAVAAIERIGGFQVIRVADCIAPRGHRPHLRNGGAGGDSPAARMSTSTPFTNS